MKDAPKQGIVFSLRDYSENCIVAIVGVDRLKVIEAGLAHLRESEHAPLRKKLCHAVEGSNEPVGEVAKDFTGTIYVDCHTNTRGKGVCVAIHTAEVIQ